MIIDGLILVGVMNLTASAYAVLAPLFAKEYSTATKLRWAF